jgi:multidrug efflux pump subunit AcrB
VVALIGIILLIGIVQKNAIMMIDFALDLERKRRQAAARGHLSGVPAAFPADFDDDFAAMFGGLPLALGNGVGSELRKPLGIAIVGGLIVSQVLTLYTTPVIYLFFDRLAKNFPTRAAKRHDGGEEIIPAETP